MVGILVNMTNTNVSIEPVVFEGNPGKYGRYEIITNHYDSDNLIREFEREMKCRYTRVLKGFDFSPYVKTTIKKVIFNNPATIVIWSDDSKTVVKCQPGDVYSEELGLAMCISKKFLGNKGNFNEEFKKWLPEEPITDIKDKSNELSIEEMRDLIKSVCYRIDCSTCPLVYEENCYTHATDEEVIKNYNKIKDLI